VKNESETEEGRRRKNKQRKKYYKGESKNVRMG
jgi:hypothetical protein